jgi:hypothetical protein
MLAKLGDGAALLNLPEETLAAIKGQAARAEAQAVVRATTLFNEALVDIKSSLLTVPQLPLELAFVTACTPASTPASTPPIPTTPVATPSPVDQTVAASPTPARPPKVAPVSKPAPPPPPPPGEIAEPVVGESDVDITVDTVRSCMGRVIKSLEHKNKVMAETLRSQVRLYKVSGREIYFNTSDMLKKRFEKPQPQLAINEAFNQAIGQRVIVRFMSDKDVAQTESGDGEDEDEDAEALLKVAEELGGKVVK